LWRPLGICPVCPPHLNPALQKGALEAKLYDAEATTPTRSRPHFMASKPRPQRGLNIPDYDCLRSKEVVAQLTSLNSMRTWRVTWMWSFLMCFSATTTPLYVLKANRQWAAPTAKSAIYICPVLECIKEIKRRFRPFHENSTGELYICSK